MAAVYYGPSKKPGNLRLKVPHARWPIDAPARWCSTDPKAADALLTAHIRQAIDEHQYQVELLTRAHAEHCARLTILWPNDLTDAERALGVPLAGASE